MNNPNIVYSYEQLNNGCITGETSASGYYLQPVNYGYEPTNTIVIDMATKEELKSYYRSAIIIFGLFSVCFTSLIFAFSFLWCSIAKNYHDLEIISIISCILLSLCMVLFLILFIRANKNYNRTYNSLFDQGIFLT